MRDTHTHTAVNKLWGLILAVVEQLITPSPKSAHYIGCESRLTTLANSIDRSLSPAVAGFRLDNVSQSGAVTWPRNILGFDI